MSFVSSADIRAALATLLQGITGITTGFAWKPQSLLSHELPAAILSPQVARYTYPSAQEAVRGRLWEALVFAKKAESGAEYQAEQAAETALDLVLDELVTYERVILSDKTFCYMRLEEDTHVVRMPFGADTYAGFVLRLRLTDGTYYTPQSD